MRVGIDIRHLAKRQYSGVDMYTMRLIEALAENYPGDEFFLFAAGSKKSLANLPTFSQNNIRVFKKTLPNKLVSLLLALPFGRQLEDWMDEVPDVWLFPNLNVIRTKLPYAITVHDLSFLLYPEFFSFKQRLWHRLTRFKTLMKEASHVFAVSASTKQDTVALLNIPPENITVTHLGVEPHYQPKQQPSDANFRTKFNLTFPYFLTLSTREPRKNLASVVDAYDAWRHQHQDNAPHLVIAGGPGWRSKDLHEALNSAWFKDDIHLIGYVGEAHKPALYRGATAFFFPSFYEGFGLPALEAMACGTPVITSFSGSMPEVVNDAAIMVDPYNISDLEQVFEQLPSIENQLRVRGPLQASTFTWQTTAKTTYEALFQIGALRR